MNLAVKSRRRFRSLRTTSNTHFRTEDTKSCYLSDRAGLTSVNVYSRPSFFQAPR